MILTLRCTAIRNMSRGIETERLHSYTGVCSELRRNRAANVNCFKLINPNVAHNHSMIL